MKALLIGAIILFVALTGGCYYHGSYICEFTPAPQSMDAAREKELFARVTALATKYGMSVFIREKDWILFHKGADKQAPEPYREVDGSYETAVNISYKFATHWAMISQGYEMKPSEFTLKIKADLEALYKEFFGEDGFEMKEGIRSKAWGA